MLQCRLPCRSPNVTTTKIRLLHMNTNNRNLDILIGGWWHWTQKVVPWHVWSLLCLTASRTQNQQNKTRTSLTHPGFVEGWRLCSAEIPARPWWESVCPPPLRTHREPARAANNTKQTWKYLLADIPTHTHMLVTRNCKLLKRYAPPTSFEGTLIKLWLVKDIHAFITS